MRVLVLGGTTFIGRRIVEKLHERGDQVLVVHRGRHRPRLWVPVDHLLTDRQQLARHADAVRDFAPQAVIDTFALTGRDVTSVLEVLPEVPAVVLSSQDVYQAVTAFRAGRCDAPVPLDENSELRRDRYPYKDLGGAEIPADYDKLDVEDAWLARGAVALRLPMVYGPFDPQRREDAVLRRLRAGRNRVPVGPGNLLWTRGHVADIADGVLAALGTREADGLAINLGERQTVPVLTWFEQIAQAADAQVDFVRVPEQTLPPDLAITRAPSQHLLASVTRAEQLLGWAPPDSQQRVRESVRWHLDNPPAQAWTDEDEAADTSALSTV